MEAKTLFCYTTTGFLVAELDELAHAAVRIESDDSLISHPADDATHLIFINSTLGIAGKNVRNEDAVGGFTRKLMRGVSGLLGH